MSKQETLQEAAERFRSNNPGTMQGGNNTKILNAFIAGAKWQGERMYSEEDLKEAFRGGRKTSWIKTDSFEEWFEQFKKK
jgi:hypothetical protein